MKRIVALALASALVMALAVTGVAASGGTDNVGVLAGSLADGYGVRTVQTGDVVATATDDDGETFTYKAENSAVYGKQGMGTFGGDVYYANDIVPAEKEKEYINLYTDMFTWPGGRPQATYTDNSGGPNDGMRFQADVDGNTPLSAQVIRANRMDVRTTVRSGSKAIDSVRLDARNSRIEIQYVSEYVSTKDLDFDFTVYLVIDGKRQTQQGLTFVGTLANGVTEVYADTDYVDASNGQVVHAQEFVSKIEVNLGAGVSLHTKMFKDKKYYGTASRESDASAEVVFARYPDIDHVVALRTVGLNSSGDRVSIDAGYNGYYVYNGDLEYLGRSGDLLPYSSRYYLANRELDTGDSGKPQESGEQEQPQEQKPETPPAGGNANANPGTGR